MSLKDSARQLSMHVAAFHVLATLSVTLFMPNSCENPPIQASLHCHQSVVKDNVLIFSLHECRIPWCISDFTKPHSRERVRQGRPFCGELQLGGEQLSFPTPAVFQPNLPAVNTSYQYKTKPLVSQNILLHSNGVGKHLLL